MIINIKDSDKAEFIGQIIELFEDFLEGHGIELTNEDKQFAIADGEDADTLAVIYGEDYDILLDGIEYLLLNWSNKND